MADTVIKYRIFLASPSDVKEERESLKEVIDELNKTFGNRNKIVLELLKWETDSAPGINETSVQDIIDDDIGNNYDLFVGILFSRFGTPTHKYGSGTEQEFQNAVERFKNNKNSIQILFYFKITEINLNDLDADEYSKVVKFKKSLGDKNTFYWEYDTSSNLQKYLRTHIPIRIESLMKSNKGGNKVEKEIIETEEILNEELGLIDYQEIYEKCFADAFSATGEMTDIMTTFSKDMVLQVEEIKQLNLRGLSVGNKEKRKMFQKTAKAFDTFSENFKAQIPIYFNNFEKGTDALEKIILLSRTIVNSNGVTEKPISLEEVVNLINSIQSTSISIKSFLEMIVMFPRMEKELNRSRTKIEGTIKELLSKLEISVSILEELKKSIS